MNYSLIRIANTLASNALVQHENNDFQQVWIASEPVGSSLLQNSKRLQVQKLEAIQEKQPDNSLSGILKLLLVPEKKEEVLGLELLKRNGNDKIALHL